MVARPTVRGEPAMKGRLALPGGKSTERAVLLLVSVLAIASTIRAWNYSQPFAGIDFYQFWAVGRTVRDPGAVDVFSEEQRTALGQRFLKEAESKPGSRVHAAAQRREALETYSTPFLYTLFGLLWSGDYERDYQRYVLLCLACTVLATVALCRTLRLPSIPMLAALALLLEMEPRRSDARVGNVNQIQLALVALFLWLQSRRRRRWMDLTSGAVLGIALAFKPNVAAVALLLGASWLFRRRLEKLGLVGLGTAAGAALAVAVSSAAMGGIRIWQSWLAAVRNLPDSIIPVSLGNVAPAMLLKEHWGVEAGSLLAAGLALLTLVFLWRARSTARSQEEDSAQAVLIAGLGAALVLLAARLVWLHYLWLAVPLMLVPFRAAKVPLSHRLLAALGILLIGAAPPALAHLGDATLIATLSCAGLALVFGLGLATLAGSPAARRN
jgi:glycosyl transferase family 87